VAGSGKTSVPTLRVLIGALLLASTVVVLAPQAPGQDVGQIDPRTMLSEQPLRTWQVVDLQAPSGSTLPDWDVLVWDFAELNGVMYVGGRFQKVRRSSGETEHHQPFLAAFDVVSGEWISSFRPVIDDGVYALDVTPDGTRLLVGGEFSNINGAPLTSGLAALDPFTGAPDPTWKASFTSDGSPLMVKDIEVSGDHVYVAGRFSHVQNPGAAPTRRYSLARLGAVDGQLESWTVPVNGGRVMSLAATPDGQELYLGGFFTTVGQVVGTKWLAGIDVATQSAIALADPLPADDNWYVYMVLADDDRIYAGTEKHRLFIWDRETTVRTHHYYSAGFGGDYQALLLGQSSDRAVIDGVVQPARPILWAGGHHHGWEQRVGAGDTRRTQVLWLSAYDAVTGERVIGWTPRLGMRDGVFALAQDSEGKLWVGGDPTSAGQIPVSGFAVLPHPDPSDPVNLARGRAASQSTTGESGLIFAGQTPERRCDNVNNDLVSPPGAAVDGKIAGSAGECSYSVTSAETAPWWQVDLGQVGQVDLIRVWNMYSSYQPENLTDLWIAVSADADAINSTDPVALAADPAVTLVQYPGQLPWFGEIPVGVYGRYVRLFLNSQTPVQLRLPEVEVIDLAGVEPPPLVDPSKTLVSKGSTWRYLDGGSVPPADWAEPGFDDGAWAEGPALLGFGDADVATVVAAGATTTYLRTSFTMTADEVDATDALSLELLADDGAVAYLNGVEVRRLRMPPGPIGPSTEASETVWGAAERAWSGSTVPTAALRPGVNILAVELHNNWISGSDLAGGAALSILDGAENGNGGDDAGDEILVAYDGQWRYLQPTAGEPGPDPGWPNLDYDDGSWPVGAAQIGYGDGDEATVLDPPPDPGSSPTLWFRHRFDVSDPSAFDHLVLSLVRDDGAIVYLNGAEVARTNLADGAVNGSDPASDLAWGPGEREALRLIVPATALQPGGNVVAVQLHQAPAGGHDASFALELIGRAP
jgi:hypothetical protein